MAPFAEAHRSATKRERKGIDRALGPGLAGVHCSRLLVSTATTGYARMTGTNARGCSPGDGYLLLARRDSGQWVVLFGGPFERISCRDFSDEVAPSVSRDLGLCR